jgi:hypothetical protein
MTGLFASYSAIQLRSYAQGDGTHRHDLRDIALGTPGAAVSLVTQTDRWSSRR